MASATPASGVTGWGQVHLAAGMQPARSHPARLTGGSSLAGGSTLHAASTSGPMISGNWAGMVDTGSQFTGVSATWTVPAVQAASNQESSSTWIGIDGLNDSSLIQTGTAQETSGGATSYYAWYEILPAAAVPIGDVSPGDRMSASIQEVSPGSWSLSIDDLTAGTTAGGTLAYSGPGTSAEWIEEAPTAVSTGSVMTLADFGRAEFDGISATASGAGTASAPSPIEMVDGSGNVIAYPGAYDPATASFPVTYGSPVTTTTTSTTGTGTSTTGTGTSTTGTQPVSTAPVGTQPVGTQPVGTAPVGTAPVAAATPPSTATAPTTPVHPPVPACDRTLPSGTVVGMATTGDGLGYWIADRSGQVAACGDAPPLGGAAGAATSPVVAIAGTPDGGGYWLATARGRVLTFGDAHNYGQLTTALAAPIVGMAADPATGGYWLLGADGGVFSFNSPFRGSTGGMRLNAPAVGMVATANGAGYYFVASDGGVFAFNAPFHGSAGSIRLNRPVVGMALDAATGGYWLDASDGGIFSYDAPFEGSTGSLRLNQPCVSMTAYPAGPGYRFVAADGGVFDFGAPFEGSAAA